MKIKTFPYFPAGFSRALGAFLFVDAIILLALLTACAGLPYDPHGLSPEVVKYLTQDNKMVVVCTKTMTPWGPVFQMQIAGDTGSMKNGGVNVSGDCATAFTNAQNPPKVTTVTTTTVPQ